MPAKQDEKLDDVIANLIDDDAGDNDDSSAFEGIDQPSGATNGSSVTLTDRAARQVEKIKADQNLGDELYLRVAVEGGGCSGLSYKLGLDHKNEEDTVFESKGIEIVVDRRHIMYLEGISIDYPDGLDARGFVFNNPNANETCGCGTSFAT